MGERSASISMVIGPWAVSILTVRFSPAGSGAGWDVGQAPAAADGAAELPPPLEQAASDTASTSAPSRTTE